MDQFVQALLDRLHRAWELHDLPLPQLILEPGRSLVGRAGLTLYRVGVVKRASETTTYVAIDGGMSDNPRPQLYGARYAALLANRADEPPTAAFCVCGKHCESGDVLIDRVDLPEPRRGDLLAVPATGAYTLGMGSNYNSVPRPAAVLVADGEAKLIRRRETVDDLFAFERRNRSAVVVHDLDVVPVRVEDVGAVVPRVVDRPFARRAVVAVPGFGRGAVKASTAASSVVVNARWTCSVGVPATTENEPLSPTN